MRTFVSPIGYNSTSVTRPLLSFGIDSGDEVVLVRPLEESDDNRASEAIADVERLLSEIEPQIDLVTERVAHDDFRAAVLSCSDLLEAATGDVVVNLGGGARDVLLPFALAAVTHAVRIDTVLFFSDVDGSVREWELPRLAEAPTGPARETLAVVADSTEPNSLSELTDRRDVSKTTIARHVDELEAVGAVRTWADGKAKRVEVRLGGALTFRARGVDDAAQ